MKDSFLSKKFIEDMKSGKIIVFENKKTKWKIKKYYDASDYLSGYINGYNKNKKDKPKRIKK